MMTLARKRHLERFGNMYWILVLALDLRRRHNFKCSRLIGRWKARTIEEESPGVTPPFPLWDLSAGWACSPQLSSTLVSGLCISVGTIWSLDNVVVKSMGTRARLPGFESQLYHLPNVGGTSGNLFDPSRPCALISSSVKWDNNQIYLIGLLRGLNEFICINA